MPRHARRDALIQREERFRFFGMIFDYMLLPPPRGRTLDATSYIADYWLSAIS
jgi:hypothetical protein